MKRVIKTYENCGDDILQQLAEKFPNGIKNKHISKIPTVKGGLMKVVELQTEDTLYLIKFSEQLENAIDNFDLDLEEDVDAVGIDEDGIDVAVVGNDDIPTIADETDEDED